MTDPDGTEEPWKEPQGPDPRPLGDALAAFVGRRGWRRRMEGARVHASWREIAGEELARHSEPVRLHGGVLVVRVDSTVWATQVRALVGPLLRRTNAVLGPGQARTVTVVTGALERREAPGG